MKKLIALQGFLPGFAAQLLNIGHILTVAAFLLYSISLSAQQTENISIGLSYSYQYLDMQKSSVTDQFVLDGNYGTKSDWNQEQLDWFNEGSFTYQLHIPTLLLFSGLTGTSESKFRFGFGIQGGLMMLQEETYNPLDSLLRKNNNVHFYGGGILYGQYAVNANWLIRLDIRSFYSKGDLNKVTDYHDIFDNPRLYTTSYDNSIEMLNSSAFLRVAYIHNKFQFALGPEFAYVYATSSNTQRIYDITNDYYLIDYEDYTANNSLIIRGRLNIQYTISPNLLSYASLSISKDVVAQIGIQYQFSK